MKLYKIIILLILSIFIGIQFIKPTRNAIDQVLPTDITKTINIPDKVLYILKNTCYDCHSNNTRYPWYVNIQPIGWIMAKHVKTGKDNLNFSEFANYSKRKQANKLRSIANSIKEGSMPLSSYMIMHKDARLSKINKDLIANWALESKDSIEIKN